MQSNREKIICKARRNGINTARQEAKRKDQERRQRRVAKRQEVLDDSV